MEILLRRTWSDQKLLLLQGSESDGKSADVGGGGRIRILIFKEEPDSKERFSLGGFKRALVIRVAFLGDLVRILGVYPAVTLTFGL